MDRRSFLALAASSAAEAQSQPPIGIAFLGLTHAHAQAKLQAVRAAPQWRIAGVCEGNVAVREKLRAQNIPLLSRSELLTHPEVQVVAVESDVRDHAADGLAVLEAGKHLHVEKAPANTMEGFEKMVAAARRRRRLLQVGYMWRYHPGITKALEAARDGWLGTIYMVRGSIGNLMDGGSRPALAEFTGGIIFELGCHVIDPLVRLMGRPRKVASFLRKDGAFEDKLHDNITAVFEWENAIGTVYSTTLQPASSRYRAVEIFGTNGCAIVNPIEPPGLTVDLARPAGPYGGLQKIALPPYRRYEDDFMELAAAVRGEAQLRVTPDEDLVVHEALLRASGMLTAQATGR